MMNKNFRRSLIAVSVSAMFTISVPSFAASNSSGGIKGHIVSADSSSLSGATIVIVNKENGATKTVVANENGNFRIPSLAIGDYKVTISKPGYETQVIESAIVTIGNEVTIDTTMNSGDIERISVTGSRVAMVDTASPEISLSISSAEIARLPISQDITSVALLAPGTTKGDEAFGNRASFGGASVAENSYIINGVNVTGFRNGLSIADIPFTAYDEFQVKTGGYSAQFGRSTGGVINAVTKSGGNEWKFDINARWEPNALREQSPNVRYAMGNGTSIMPFDMYIDNSHDEKDDFEAELAISGPLIKDTLFVYGLIQPQKYKERAASANGLTYTDREYDDPLWLGRVDWQINEDHKLMVWGFSDSEDVKDTTKYWNDAGPEQLSVLERGGTTWSVKYDGRLNDWLSVDALYANVEFNSTQQAPEDESCPLIIDARGNSTVNLGCWQNSQPSAASDERKQYNINFYISYFDDHQLKVGLDYEDNTSSESSFYSGHVYYRYYSQPAGFEIENGYVLPEDMEFVRTRLYENGGEFSSGSMAWYIEDTWSILPNLTARIGIRNESFENKNANDNTFIKIDNQWAPRLGLTWDIFDDGASKVFANFGRYHIPVASNTNIRLSGAELFTADWNRLDGVNADGTPIIGPSLGGGIVYGNGEASSPDEIVDANIEPMYQDEYILGYQQNLDEDWAAGIKFTHRDLKRVIDDVSINHALSAQGYDVPGDILYVLTNPNTDMSVYYDTNGDGTPEQITLSAEDLGYPDPKRKYSSVELTLNRRWNDDWMLNASYTWAHSYGNAEGYVKSDNGQDDAGLTTDWDFPYLMDGANGNLPNDRRHTIKVFGAYQLTDNVTVGSNITAQSGRPKSALSYSTLPDGYDQEYQYGDTFYPFGQKCSRGCMGTEAWTFTVDANITYRIDYWENIDANVKLDVFNLFDAQTTTRSNEYLDDGGQTNPAYGLTDYFQTPRYVRLSLNVSF